MGIRNLNRYISNNCSLNSIKSIHLQHLSDKTIVVDTSIYLYKYESINLLLENIYLMISIFHFYKINLIFIFDGKSSNPLKQHTLKKRKQEKLDATIQYNSLTDEYNNATTVTQKKHLMDGIKNIKKKITWITSDKINRVKKLMSACGVAYYTAPSEADEICAQMVLTKKAWACLSEDMDMFVYGCTRVLRYFSLVNHSVVLYDMNLILEDLNMSQQEFINVCTISETDYTEKQSFQIQTAFDMFLEYKQSTSVMHFYDWIKENKCKYLDIELLTSINALFQQTNIIPGLKKISTKNIPPKMPDIISILNNEGFIFV